MGRIHGARAVNREPQRQELHRINVGATPSDCPTLTPWHILHSTKESTGGYRRLRTHLENTPLGPRRRPCRIANGAKSWVSTVATVGFSGGVNPQVPCSTSAHITEILHKFMQNFYESSLIDCRAVTANRENRKFQPRPMLQHFSRGSRICGCRGPVRLPLWRN